MRFIILIVFVSFFVVLPMYLLDTQVLPSLGSLQQSYAAAGAVAQQVASPAYTANQ